MSQKYRFLKVFLHQINLKYRIKNNNKGFTLTELLIAVFTAAIVISALLTAMVQILESDRRETQRTQIQQQTQSALNYIAQDLREAVYVYPGSSSDPNKTTIANIEPFLPDYSSKKLKPILAFWKTQSIPEKELPSINSIDCSDTINLTTVEQEKCNLNVKRNEYVLVVYYQPEPDAPDGVWEGKSRILRYELPKYSDPANVTVSDGYLDPSEYKNNFATWPKDENGNPVTDLNGNPVLTTSPSNSVNPPVLIDFVDDPNATVSNQLTCPANFSRTPATGNSFYACVRQPQSLGDKQNIIINLRGNEQKKEERNFADTFRPVAQTQITIGGAIDKSITEN